VSSCCCLSPHYSGRERAEIQPGPHGFHADYRPSYRKEAAEDAWKMAIDWLKKNKVLS